MFCTRQIRNDEGKTIALVGYQDYANDVFEDTANARLIAAAPDLLAALKSVMAAVVVDGNCKAKIELGVGSVEWLNARAAIAKATA
jgi:hypothetical protein